MKRTKTLGILIIAAAACAAIWWGFLAPHMVFQLYDRKNEAVVLEVPAEPGDRLRLEIEHSFEHIPWYEYYTITGDGSFNLDAIAVAGYGAGIPAGMSVPTHIEDGLVWMEEINTVFEQFTWTTSATYMKGLLLNDREIFDFRSLPDASRIRGDIIIKRGYIHFG